MMDFCVSMFVVGLKYHNVDNGYVYGATIGVFGFLCLTPLLIGLFFLRRQWWSRPSHTAAEPDGATDGSQPSSSATNRKLGAAGSCR